MNVVQTLLKVDVFLEKVLENVQAESTFFRVYFLISLTGNQFISFVEKKANSAIKQQKCKNHEKRDRLLASKREFSFQFFKKKNNLPIDPNFSH